jgi:hypothetical protein
MRRTPATQARRKLSVLLSATARLERLKTALR